MRSRVVPVVVRSLLVLMLAGVWQTAEGQKVYWVDSGTPAIQRANLDGSQVEDLVLTALNRPVRIAIDNTNERMFWVDQGSGEVKSADLVGGDVQTLVQGIGVASGVALDVAAGQVYWSDDGALTIRRSNFAGGQIEDVVVGVGSVYGIALDLAARQVYWTEGAQGEIRRASLDGPTLPHVGGELVLAGLPGPDGIEIDAIDGVVYWADSASNTIHRANLDGTGVEDISPAGLGNPEGVALNPGRNVLFFSDSVAPAIRRMGVSGGDVQGVVLSGIVSPRDVAWCDCGYDVAAPQRPNPIRLAQNTPNPFNPRTVIDYEVDVAGRVLIEVFDVSGRHVRTLVDQLRQASQVASSVVWDGLDDLGRPMASGVYYYKLEAGGQTRVRKMVLLR